MAKGILGTKLGMTQVFDEEGQLVPVTVVQCEPNVVLQKKTEENDGYEAVQLGYKDKPERLANRPELGHVRKADTSPKRYVKEIAGKELSNFEVGQEIRVNIFENREHVDVTGTSKGKGFQGNIKRHNQSTGPKTHGSHSYREPGATGTINPNRVMPGMKLPGHMGHETITIQNLEIVKVDEERNLLLIKGNVPGPKKSLVMVRRTVKEDPVEPLDPSRYVRQPASETAAEEPQESSE